MLLAHITKIKYLEKILKDKKLKSNALTNKFNIGDGIYYLSKLVFFNIVDKINSKYQIGFKNYEDGEVVLYFDYNLLYNRLYYESNHYSDRPDLKLSKWKFGNRILYNKMYPRYHKNTKKNLSKLFNNSIKVLQNGKAFFVFQQIAIKNECNLKYLRYIRLNKTMSDRHINDVKKILKDSNLDVELII